MSRPNNFNYRNLDVERVRMQQPFNYRNLEVEPTRMTEFPDEEVYLANRPEAKPIAQRALYTSGLKVYPKLSKGGYMPKYEDGATKPFGPELPKVNVTSPEMLTSQYNTNMLNSTSYAPNVLPWERKNDSGMGPNGAADKYTPLNPTEEIRTHVVNRDTTTPTSSDQQGFNWKNLAGQVGMGLVQNAGNLYNLSRYNKPEIEKYERLQSNLVSDRAAIRDAEMEAKRAASDMRNMGLGVGALTTNRLGLSAQNVINKDRMRQQYANTNAEIQNRANQYNTQLAMQEVIANAQNRARDRSGKGEAIAGIGQNVSQQMLDAKKGKMDEKTLAMYQSYFNNPQFKAAMKKAGYDLG
jgi:hypothetical protein